MKPSTLDKITQTLTTMTRILRVFGCAGETFHVSSGVSILRNGKGYSCPQCGAEVRDITDTPVGKEYFGWLRADLYPPLQKSKPYLPHRAGDT